MDEQALRGLADTMIQKTVQLCSLLQKHLLDDGRYRINSQSFGVLFRICHAPDRRMTLSALGQAMRIGKPQLSKLINTLEDDGLIARIRARQDRRSVDVVATDDGMAYIQQVFDSGVDGLSCWLGQLPPEQLLELSEGLDKLADMQ